MLADTRDVRMAEKRAAYLDVSMVVLTAVLLVVSRVVLKVYERARL